MVKILKLNKVFTNKKGSELCVQTIKVEYYFTPTFLFDFVYKLKPSFTYVSMILNFQINLRYILRLMYMKHSYIIMKSSPRLICFTVGEVVYFIYFLTSFS